MALEPALKHTPVLVSELIELLDLKPGLVVVDGTLGAGGHAKAVLETLPAKLIGIDQDEEILKFAKENLKNFGERVSVHQGNFAQLDAVLKQEGIQKVDRIYVDLGLSSFQLEEPQRGFSFNKEGPIDMRMDINRLESAWQKLKQTNIVELTRVLEKFGEERLAPKIAKGILEKMKKGELKKTHDLAQVAISAYPPKAMYKGIHPATRTFQAIRIWVNEELNVLSSFLQISPGLLNKGGRVGVISYHSLEDRLVKQSFKKWGQEESFRIVTKKPVVPSQAEVQKNPRSRSAKLRVLERML